MDRILSHTASLPQTDSLVQSNYSGAWEINLSSEAMPILPLNKIGVLLARRMGKGILGRQLPREFVCNGVFETLTK